MSAAKRALKWERRPEARPQELLEAALRVFATRGYRNTRLEEVAAEAGVTKGALYHYFENKEELLLRAIQHYQARAFGRMEEAMRGEQGPASARLRRMVESAFSGNDDARRDVLLLLNGLAHAAPDVYREWLATGPMQAWRLITAIIEDGKKSGEFRADADSEVAARLLVSGLVTQLVWQYHAGDVPGIRIGHRRLIRSAIDLCLAGLHPAALP
jgi:AcrR family transcriptional regulator